MEEKIKELISGLKKENELYIKLILDIMTTNENRESVVFEHYLNDRLIKKLESLLKQ